MNIIKTIKLCHFGKEIEVGLSLHDMRFYYRYPIIETRGELISGPWTPYSPNKLEELNKELARLTALKEAFQPIANFV